MKQLSVFLENKKGSLAKITELLTKEHIDIDAMSIADTADFGILRMVVSDYQKGYEILKANDIIVSITEVTVAMIKHEVGSLSAILEILDNENINIEYMYAFTAVSGEEAYAVFRFEDGKKGVETLKQHNVTLYSKEDFKKN